MIASVPITLKTKVSFNKFMKQYLNDGGLDLTIGEVRESLSDNKFEILNEMFTWCQDHEKKIILTTLPYEPAFRYMKDGKELKIVSECRSLAKHFSGTFYNGLDGYSNLDKKDLSECFLPFDVHWSQKGSDRFAEQFFNLYHEKLIQNN
jgi:hypothetical protein